MRNLEEVSLALEETVTLPIDDWMRKYHIRTIAEARGFRQALEWFLEEWK